MLYPAAVTTTGATFLSHVAIILIVSSNTAIAHSQAVPESHRCPICFEQYAAPDTLPRMLVNCGHTFCEPCLRKMLAPLLAADGAKVTAPATYQLCACPLASPAADAADRADASVPELPGALRGDARQGGGAAD
jgi:hypothetical protein